MQVQGNSKEEGIKSNQPNPNKKTNYLFCSLISSDFDIRALRTAVLWCLSMCRVTCCAASSFPNGVLIIHPHSGQVNDVVSGLLIRPPPGLFSGLIGYCYVCLIKYLEDAGITKKFAFIFLNPFSIYSKS